MRLLRTAPVQAATGLILMLGLTACSANHHSIWRLKPIPEGEAAVASVDSKQRLIIASSPKTTTTIRDADGQVQTKTIVDQRRVCAEPSPDVLTVLAQAYGASAELQKSADPTSLGLGGSLSISTAEQGTTIPRTQTINMLREMMYRTCERYLNDGLTADELAIQAVRDQRMMISTLAIEQLTGAVTPKPVIISASGSAAAGSSGADAVVRIDDARKALVAATSAEMARRKEFDEENGTAKACDAIKKLVDDKKEDSLTDEQKAKRPKCEAAAQSLASATSTLADAKKHHSDLLQASSQGGLPTSASTAVSDAASAGGIAQANAAASVAKAVTFIVEQNFNDHSEIILYCIKAGLGVGADTEVRSECRKLMAARVSLVAEQTLAAAREYGAVQSQLDEFMQREFDRFWAKAGGSANGDANAAALGSVVDSLIASLKTRLTKPTRDKLLVLRVTTSRAAAQHIFSNLEQDIQVELGK